MDASSASTNSEPCKAAFGALSSDVQTSAPNTDYLLHDGVCQGPILRIVAIRAISSLGGSAGQMSSQSQVSRTRRSATADPRADMVFVRAASFAWVRTGTIRRKRQRTGQRRRMLDRQRAGDEPPVPQVRQRDEACHLRRGHAEGGRLSGALPHMLKAGSLVFSPPKELVDLNDWVAMVAIQIRRRLAKTVRASQFDQRNGRSSRRARRLSRRGGLRALGPARNCRPRPNGSLQARGGLDGAEYSWGDEFTPNGKPDGQHVQGAFPQQNLKQDGFERTSPVRSFPPNGYGIHDMIGNGWEWTTDFWSTRHPADAPKACCVPQKSRGGARGAELRRVPARDSDPTQGAERRLASLRAELLPPLPARRAARRAGRHLHKPCRLSLVWFVRSRCDLSGGCPFGLMRER